MGIRRGRYTVRLLQRTAAGRIIKAQRDIAVARRIERVSSRDRRRAPVQTVRRAIGLPADHVSISIEGYARHHSERTVAGIQNNRILLRKINARAGRTLRTVGDRGRRDRDGVAQVRRDRLVRENRCSVKRVHQISCRCRAERSARACGRATPRHARVVLVVEHRCEQADRRSCSHRRRRSLRQLHRKRAATHGGGPPGTWRHALSATGRKRESDRENYRQDQHFTVHCAPRSELAMHTPSCRGRLEASKRTCYLKW